MPLGTVGKYERLDVLGHGVSGIVYLAKDTLLNRQVALKEVDVQAGDVRRFLEEARVMDRLRHPNIVRVHGVDRVDGKVLIDMEYVRGQNLQQLLRQEGCLPLDRALDITLQILDGLDYAHQMQTVHRDIKPANILVANDGSVKLADFGLAEILATNAYAGGAGTYAYMAPEDFAEEAHSDHQSDLWAVGITLYEMLTASRPFLVQKVKDPFAWKRALETQTPAPIADLLPEGSHPALQAVLDRVLARDKRLRYPTAIALREDTARLRAGELPCEETWRVHRLVALEREDGATVAGMAVVSDSNPVASQDGFEAVSNPSASPSASVNPSGNPPGVVVADVNSPASGSTEGRFRLPFGRRPTEVVTVVEPDYIDFGRVRQGEQRTVRLRVRTQGIAGSVGGRVRHDPGWLTAEPQVFDRARQTIQLTAHTGRIWESGEFHEKVRVETRAGATEIPVRLFVLPSRQTFSQVAWWYIPLFLLSLLPVALVAFGLPRELSEAMTGEVSSIAVLRHMAPAAAVSSAGLSLMLLLIAIAADLGFAERAACGTITAAMCFVLGMLLSHPTVQSGDGPMRALLVGAIFLFFLLLQLLSASRWRLWGWLMVVLSLFASASLLVSDLN